MGVSELLPDVNPVSSDWTSSGLEEVERVGGRARESFSTKDARQREGEGSRTGQGGR